MRFLHIPGFLIACIVIILVFPALAVKMKLGEDGYTCRVWSVTDGDTLRCGDGKLFYSIRLAGIDAPEKSKKEYGWEEAKNELEKMTPKNRDIILKFDNSVSTAECELNDPDNYYDRYDRVLAYVILPKGEEMALCPLRRADSVEKNVNVEMVKTGWAEVSVKNPPKRFKKEFTAAEEEAMKGLLGIWSQEVYIADTVAGKEYHPENCHHLATSRKNENEKKITRAEAKKKHLTRCSQWDKKKRK